MPGSRVVVEPTGSGPLDGLEFAAKDVFDVAGQRTSFGHPAWLETHEPARTTAPAVERLLAAGARLVGKTVTDELTYGLSGENPHYGTPTNPRCPDRLPGGSSSGSASAVAGGACDFALGTDCAGSVRIPASYCGLYGLRTTHGAVPVDGVCALAPSFDTVGWLARDAAVLERTGTVLLPAGAEPDGDALPACVLVARDAFALAEPAVAHALAGPVRLVGDLAGSVREITVSPEGLGRWMQAFRVIQASEIWQGLGPWVEAVRPQLGDGVSERLAWAASVTAEDAERERRFRATVSARLDELLDGAILCLPTAPSMAPKRAAPIAEVEQDVRARALSLLCIAGLGGLPQLTMPLAEADGCPVGLSLVGPRGSDRMLLRLAAQLRQ